MYDEFLAADAVEDKIDLVIGKWKIIATDEAFFRFCHYFGSPKEGNEGEALKTKIWGHTFIPSHGWFFGRPKRGKMYIRSKGLFYQKTKIYQPVLCGGFLAFKREVDEKHCRTATLTLSLNLQRFIRHQPKEDESPPEGEFPKNCRLRHRKDKRSAFGKEHSWDGSDNWIPNTSAWRKFTSPKKRELHLTRYIHAICKQVESDALRAIKFSETDYETVTFERESMTCNLRQVENAWEFESHDPVSDVADIGMDAIHYSKKEGKGDLYEFIAGSGREMNSPCIRVPLRAGVQLKIYAKTNCRLRIEIVSDDISNRLTDLVKAAEVIIPQDPQRNLDYGKLPHLILVLRLLKREAADCLNELMEDLRNSKRRPKPKATLRFLTEVVGAIPVYLTKETRLSLARSMLDLLVHHKGIRPGNLSPDMLEAMGRLKESGVIEYDSTRQFYRPTLYYIPAVILLRALDGERFMSLFGFGRPVPSHCLVGEVWFRDRHPPRE